MTSEFNHHLTYHVNSLVEAVSDNKTIMKKLYDDPSELPLEDLIELRERLLMMESNITLLNHACKVYGEVETKTKRRRLPFRK